jgi:hypothetical protein
MQLRYLPAVMRMSADISCQFSILNQGTNSRALYVGSIWTDSLIAAQISLLPRGACPMILCQVFMGNLLYLWVWCVQRGSHETSHARAGIASKQSRNSDHSFRGRILLVSRDKNLNYSSKFEIPIISVERINPLVRSGTNSLIVAENCARKQNDVWISEPILGPRATYL